jgi:hypothetical protein
VLPEVAEFRRLHASAGPRGRLSPAETKRYEEVSASLLARVLAAQHARVEPGRAPRASLRAQRALRVELTWGATVHRAVTMDVGTGGFAALLSATPPRNTAVLTKLYLSQSETLLLVARVAGARERRGTARVSFAFVDVDCDEAIRLRRCLLDDALAGIASASSRGVA